MEWIETGVAQSERPYRDEGLRQSMANGRFARQVALILTNRPGIEFRLSILPTAWQHAVFCGVAMAGRGRPTFQKRLKEQKRQEKRREKLERKLERREEKAGDPTAGSGPEIDWEAAEEFDVAEALEEFAEVQADH